MLGSRPTASTSSTTSGQAVSPAQRVLLHGLYRLSERVKGSDGWGLLREKLADEADGLVELGLLERGVSPNGRLYRMTQRGVAFYETWVLKVA